MNSGGTRLLVNTGFTTRLYQIFDDGGHREIPIRLPYITYDQGIKGWIHRWSWAGDDVLVGRGLILDDVGHNTLEARLYLYYLKDQALARLDLSGLQLQPGGGDIDVVSIGHNLQHLRLRFEAHEFYVKVDLRSPPRLLPREQVSVVPVAMAAISTAAIAGETAPKGMMFGDRKKTASAALLWIISIFVLVAFGLLLRFRKRHRRNDPFHRTR